MKKIICFIDDSRFEHDLVENHIAPDIPEFEFLQAYTFHEARERLDTSIPSLFLLDLWGQDEEVKEPILTSQQELEKRISSFPSIDQVYSGLEDFRGDVYNEYLKRLFTVVDSWRTVFEEVCSRIGQNRKYGLANLKEARRSYPGVPAVFYTRKSLISDAVALFKAGADGLLIKPTGINDEETRKKTADYAPELGRELKSVIASRSSL